MSNIFLSTAFIYLASYQAGCVDEEGVVDDDCDGRVHGMKAGSLIANIAVISSVLSALFMPLAGAMIDCTRHRRGIGILTVSSMVVIQGVQVWLNHDTWFAMAILQALAGFLYQIQVLCVYAYLPEIARAVGEKSMTNCT
jgi:MFS-type transporter involved in bile tolerance (Atg22 family)